jgi:hypothetical protein
MDLASVFDWFAQESGRAAEQANEPMQRDMFLRLALMWAAAAQQCRNEQLKLLAGTPQSNSTSS